VKTAEFDVKIFCHELLIIFLSKWSSL